MTAALLTPDEMGQADRLTIEGGRPGLDLMERAGSAVAGMAANYAPAGGRIHILCGPGNNGGDGFVAARLLAEKGYDVRVDLLKSPSGLKGDAAAAFAAMTLPFEILTSGDQLIGHMADRFTGADVIVDALFGAGLDRPLSGPAAELVEAVNGSSAAIIAVDLPSGINGATGKIMGNAIKAYATVTFFLKKPGHLLFPGRGLCGSVTVAQIGIETGVLDTIGPATFENIPDLWLASWPHPAVDGHKYSKGHAVVFSGPMASTGAARLSAMAALRAGAGLVTLASPPDALMVNASHLTAVMLKKVSGPEAIPEFLSDPRLNTVLIGPGYGIGEDTQAAVEAIIATGRSLVLDADALTNFSENPQKLFDLIKENASSAILTPHDGEFQRLFPDLTGLDKLARAREAARRSGAILILKGPDTVIAAPDGRAAINCNAPPFLATAGSGDVLAGIAAGLLAQGVPAFEAACQAVWLHGEAGRTVGPGLIAEDLAAALREPIRHLWTSLA
ncbi:NAD(P)H-hydrate dehydratase [Roseibium sp. MB-4]